MALLTSSGAFEPNPNMHQPVTVATRFPLERTRRTLRKVSYPVRKFIAPLNTARQAKLVSQHFDKFFSCHIATQKQEREGTFQLRQEVYVNEMGIIQGSQQAIETDRFDERSLHCYIVHKATGLMVGSIRLITLQSKHDDLQLNESFRESFTKPKYADLAPDKFSYEEIGEISRLTIPSLFRRKSIKRLLHANRSINRVIMHHNIVVEHQDHRQALMQQHHFTEEESCCFSFIAIALYFSAASMAIHTNKTRLYVAMKPPLARSMRLIGIKFKRVGVKQDCLGIRAPYTISLEGFVNALPLTYQAFFDVIHNQLAEDFNTQDNPENAEQALI